MSVLRHFLALAVALLLALGQAQAAPSCLPGIYGEQWPGSVLQILPVRTDRGWHAYGWCTVTDAAGVKVPSLVYRTCVHGECLSVAEMGARYGDLAFQALSGTRAAVFGAYYDANKSAYRCGFIGEFAGDGTPPVATPGSNQALACAELALLIERDRPLVVSPPPPAPVYTHRVKPNGLLPDRPAYLLSNGVRGAREVGRAGKDQGCDLMRPTLASGADVWAEFGPVFEPGRVALCSRRQ